MTALPRPPRPLGTVYSAASSPGARFAAKGAAPLAAALAAAAPFAVDPFGLDRWVFSKELLLVAAACVAWLSFSRWRMPKWWRWWLVSAAGALAVTAALGSAPLSQAIGRWPRYEGIITLGIYALAVTLGARLFGAPSGGGTGRERAAGASAVVVISAASIITAVVAAFEAAGARPLASDLERPGSLLGNASDLGVVGVVGLGLLLSPAAEGAAKRERGWRLLTVLCGAVSCVLIVGLSASRASLIAAGVVILLTALLALRRRERRREWWVVVLFTSALGVGGALFFPLTLSRLLATSPNASPSAVNRFDLWTATLELVGRNPLTGVGPNGLSDALPSTLDSTWFADTGLGGWTESAHNLPLQILAAGGLLGAIVTCALLALAAHRVRRHGLSGSFGASALVAIAGGATALLTHFTSPGPMILLCLLTGSLLAVRMEGVTRPPAARAASACALTAWALALSCAVAGDHFVARALTSLSAGDAPAADRSFATASALRPWDVDVPLRAAEQYAAAIERTGSSEHFPIAADWAERALDAVPSSRTLHASAVIAQYSGDPAFAAQQLRRAAGFSPSDPLIRQRLGAMLLLSGDIDAALTELELAAQLAPDDPGIRETLEYARGVARAR